MSDLISRQDVIDAILSEPHNEPRYPDWWVRKVMEIEPMRGEWIEISDDGAPIDYACSVCRAGIRHQGFANYCPNCGAYMGGVESETD